MKKLFCISMISLHLLNVIGGYWFFYALQNRSKKELAEQLDMDSYAGSQAITIKLPMSNFEAAEHSNYERVDGEFVYEGIAYRLVKQKFYKDTVYIVCYKDESTLAIKSALDEYVDALTDIPLEKKSESKKGFSFIKDYLYEATASGSQLPGTTAVKNKTRYLHPYLHVLPFAIDQPPELIS